MKHKFQKQWDYHPDKQHYSKNTLPSLTIPNDAMSIPEMLDLYARGLPVDGMEKVPVYHGEEQHYPDMSKMDLADQEAFIEYAKQDYETKKNNYITEQKNKQRAERKAQQLLDKKIRFIKEKESKNQNPLPPQDV